jgi:spore coat polysaccharide biosynthesis predicted glycosyltransferase SpsG
MSKPTIILATSNGVGMGHLARASAVALALKDVANPIIVSMAGGIAEIPSFMGIRCEYIPGRDRLWMSREKWDKYLRDRLLALIEETDAKVLSFDGVVPYPGVIAVKNSLPSLKLVWVRRGLWQKKPQRFILGLQAAMMDVIIEPGDIARAYDFGPTSKRKDAVLTSPVSLFRKEDALSRDDARRALGLDLNRPVALVQLGTGDSDVNHKMEAALEGLIGWKDLQVILTKAPIDKDGKSLAPAGLDIKTVRYFPLAKVLHAFDAGICATGYNGVHELLPAQVPTVFVSNIRGTDDQEARARWCHDFGYALRADQSDLNEITATVKKLQDPLVRAQLSAQCANLPDTSGGAEIAEILCKLAITEKSARTKDLTFKRLMLQDHFNRGLRHVANLGIRRLALVYRHFYPHKNREVVKESPPVFGDSTKPEELRELITSSNRFEHLISGSSPAYLIRRKEIAQEAYGKPVEIVQR